MFSTTNGFKRARDEDEPGFGEYETKKRRPGNVSPSISTIPAFISSPPSVVVPSQGDTSNIPESFREWREDNKKPALQNRRPPMLTVDTAMDIDMEDPFPLQNGDNLSPWCSSVNNTKGGNKNGGGNRAQPSPIPHHLVSESLSISGGRAATPIHGHFTVNMRPAGESTNSPGAAAPSKKEEDWWRRRRLPSPISESGDVEEGTFREGDGREGGVDIWPDSPSSMEVDGDTTTAPQTQSFLQVPKQQIDIPARLPQTAETLPPARTSKGKISFAMGYRADCPKCQMKVPGHYSHIVRS